MKIRKFSQLRRPVCLMLCKLNKLGRLNSLFAVCFLLLAMPLEAKVTGECSNCHTMHNTQNGVNMQYLAPGETDTNPKVCLLRGTCLGCHGRGPNNIVNNTPQVLHAAVTDLAGGNFAYITGAKSRVPSTEDFRRVGHNVNDLGSAYKDTLLSSPPGDQHSTNITNENFTCSGAKGCHGDRGVEEKFLSIKGAHHSDDRDLRFGSINESNQGSSTGLSYRFLYGVKGGEDSDWQATSGTADHNEYKGDTAMGTSSLTFPANNTISGLCAECHGYFHGTAASEAGSSNPWLRHPTDISLPSSGEYASYTTYSLLAPPGRTAIPDSPGETVSPSGSTDDIVTCLSCHRAHASPYFKMMRWDYKGWPGNSQTNGCNVCHTGKN